MGGPPTPEHRSAGRYVRPMGTRDEVLSDARQTLAEMELLPYGNSASFDPTARSPSAERVGVPAGESHPMRDHYARRLTDAPDAASAARVLGQARAALNAERRQPMAVSRVETLAELRQRILDDGTGWLADDVALAMRCLPRVVRRARLLAGRDPEHGRPMPTGADRMDWAVQLVTTGCTQREAAAVTGVPRSTLGDVLR